MRRETGLRLLALVVLTGLVSAVPAATTAAASSKTTTTAAHATSKLVQVGHGSFWECSSKTTQILVAINTETLHRGATLGINFVVRNQSPTACNYVAPYAGPAPGPTSTTLQAGPCGSIGYEIMGANRRNVWPGPQAFNCPALGFAQLQPGATVSGTGSWNQDKPNSNHRVAPGSYTLVVDGHYKFPLHITSQ